MQWQAGPSAGCCFRTSCFCVCLYMYVSVLFAVARFFPHPLLPLTPHYNLLLLTLSILVFVFSLLPLNFRCPNQHPHTLTSARQLECLLFLLLNF